MSSIKYSIIIPTKNRTKSCKKLLKSLITSANNSKIAPPKFEFLIIDDSEVPFQYSVDTFNLKIITKNIKKRRIYNLASARNIGINETNGEYIIFIDDDTTVPTDYFLTLDQIIQKTNFDVLGSRTYPMDHTATNIFFTLMFVNARKLGFLIGINLIIKSKLLEKIKFDEEPNFPVDDYKFFFDIIPHKPKIYYSSKLHVFHETISFKELIKKLISYSKGCRKTSKKTGKDFTFLQKNKITELNDAPSLKKEYKKLKISTKVKLVLLLCLSYFIFLLYNPNLIFKINLWNLIK